MGRTYALKCPMCGRYLGTYDGVSSIPFICDCRNCYKRIIYRHEQEEIAIKAIPPRNSSSSITFH